MKIIVSRLTDNNIGGAELSALAHHALAAKNKGFDSYFLTNYKGLAEMAGGHSSSSLIWTHAHSLIGNVLFPLKLVAFVAICLWQLIKIKPDVVNPHSRDDQIVFTMLRPFFGYKVVWKNPGDLRFALQGSARKNLFARQYEKLLIAMMKRADAIYSLNEEETALITKYVGGSTKCATIPSDILFDEYDTNADPLEKDDRLIVGTLLRLTKDKHIDRLIKAFNEIDDKQVQLWIVGNGEERDSLEKLTQDLNIGNKVKFWGFQKDVSKFYKSFDIFVQPAIHEPWGRNIREAKYFRLPIIGSDTGGIAEQLSDGSGLLFKAGDKDDLAKKLKRLLGDTELRKELGEKAHKSAVDEGDFSKKFKEQVLPLLRGDNES